MGRDGTGRDGTERNGTGRNGTERNGVGRDGLGCGWNGIGCYHRDWMAGDGHYNVALFGSKSITVVMLAVEMSDGGKTV